MYKLDGVKLYLNMSFRETIEITKTEYLRLLRSSSAKQPIDFRGEKWLINEARVVYDEATLYLIVEEGIVLSAI